MFFTWSGRLFHGVGPATEKEQSPDFLGERGTCSRFLDEGTTRFQLFIFVAQKYIHRNTLTHVCANCKYSANQHTP